MSKIDGTLESQARPAIALTPQTWDSQARPAIALTPVISRPTALASKRTRTVCVADATFSTDMNPYGRQAESLHRYDSVINCILRMPFYIGVFCWQMGVAAIYRFLRMATNFTHRSKMPGDEDAEYHLDYVAAYARHARFKCLLFAVAVVTLTVAYVVVDAVYLHWHGLRVNVLPPAMSVVTLAARNALGGSELLALYSNGNESEQSLPIAAHFKAKERIEQQKLCDWRTLISKSNAYLQINRGVEHCCCAPMFGIDVNHLALEMLQETANETKLVAVHFFNVVDTQRALYDALDPLVIANGMLKRLVVVQQSQAHLFAWPPPGDSSVVSVLRQHTLELRAMNWVGAALDLSVSAEQAYCVAECLDLFAGVSVYERARRQAAVGIKP